LWSQLPGIIAVYRIRGDRAVKEYGETIRIDFTRLIEILKEDYKIGKEQAEKLRFIKPFLGFAMVIDDLGIIYLDDMIIFVDPYKTDWDKVIKAILKEVIVK
jgi:hypothetical protein